MAVTSPGSITASGKRRVAGASIKDADDNTIGCITGWTLTINQDEAEVSCLSDTQGSPPVIQKKFKPNGSDTTYSLEGVSIFNDAGQSALRQTAIDGSEVTLQFRYYDGSGANYTGFATNYEESGSKDDFAETFSADFRINSYVFS